MPKATTEIPQKRYNATILLGFSLLVGGLIFDYLFERHNIFKVLENSPYPVSGMDLVYPPICLFLSLTGLILLTAGSLGNSTFRGQFLSSIGLAIPLTVLYSIFFLGVQFIATGADRLGECPGLDEAAATSSVILPSQWRTGKLALGCAVERRGIFLSYYNDIDVYGAAGKIDQERVLDQLAEHYRRVHSHPVQVRFYEKRMSLRAKAETE